MIEEIFYRLCYQIGSELACKSSLIAFEPINEPPCDNADLSIPITWGGLATVAAVKGMTTSGVYLVDI